VGNCFARSFELNTIVVAYFYDFHTDASFHVLLLPLGLNDGSKVLVKRHARSSKFEPLVEAEIIHATPSYAYGRLQNGREATVSLRDIALLPGHSTMMNK